MLATRKGERCRWSRKDEGRKIGWEPSAHVSTGTQNSVRNFPCSGDAGVAEAGCHIVWRCAHDTVSGWSAGVHTEDVCHVQRSAPTNLPLLDGGCAVPGVRFYDCGENVTRVKLLEV